MTHPQDPFEAFMAASFEDEAVAPPDIDSQEAYLECKNNELMGQLTKNETVQRLLFDSALRDEELGENYKVAFKRRGNGELYANVQLYNTVDEATNTHRTSVRIIPITYTDDGGEQPPRAPFNDSDIVILHSHFDQLDADKASGLLPNLDGGYDIFNPNTAIMMLGKDTAARTVEQQHDTPEE